MIEIDGSFGEGGGQILRTSLSLAAITGRGVTIENIRAGRDKPGLRPQHLTAVMAVAEICGAQVTGGEVGSSQITFRPGPVKAGNYAFDVSRIRASAGSVNLVLQTIIWPLALSGKRSRITLGGGTHVPHAPTFNYIANIFLPTIAEMGVICHYEMEKAGYYPIGGGEVRLEIEPAGELRGISLLERSAPTHIELTSAVSNLPKSIAERQMSTGIERVESMGIPYSSEISDYSSPGKGTLFFASAISGRARAGFQSLGELHKRAEKVADDACDDLHAYLESKMAIEEHLADQLIIPIALASTSSEFSTSRITQHLLTNISVVQRFLPVSFHISAGIGEAGVVRRV